MTVSFALGTQYTSSWSSFEAGGVAHGKCKLSGKTGSRRRRRGKAHTSRSAISCSGNSTSSSSDDVENVLVIGSGPAGYTAATYAGRANLRPVVLEGISSGIAGGQLMTTSQVENFPGFPDGITGPQLMSNMRKQAARWGAQLVVDDCVSLDLSVRPFVAKTASSGDIYAHSVVIATGASAKRLHIPGETLLWSRGISACAICDGAAPIFAGKDVAVVGGGDSACEEAVYLCRYARHVHLVVRAGHLRASSTLADRVLAHPSVTVHFDTVVTAAIPASPSTSPPASPLRGVRVQRLKLKNTETLHVAGLFYAIGHEPNTEFLNKTDAARQLGLVNGSGTVPVEDSGGAPFTKVAGVFAAGDVADAEWRQAVTAAGTGCAAAIAAERWLSHEGLARMYQRKEDVMQTPAPAAVEQTESGEEAAMSARGADDEQSYNVEDTWHRGQYALRKLYHESKRPLIVKYVSPGCGPCGQLKPILHAVVRALEEQVHFCEIDITEDPEIAEAAGVTGSPTVHVFFEKSLVKELRGVKMKSEYRRVVEQVLAKTSVPSSATSQRR